MWKENGVRLSERDRTEVAAPWTNSGEETGVGLRQRRETSPSKVALMSAPNIFPRLALIKSDTQFHLFLAGHAISLEKRDLQISGFFNRIRTKRPLGVTAPMSSCRVDWLIPSTLIAGLTFRSSRPIPSHRPFRHRQHEMRDHGVQRVEAPVQTVSPAESMACAQIEPRDYQPEYRGRDRKPGHVE